MVSVPCVICGGGVNCEEEEETVVKEEIEEDLEETESTINNFDSDEEADCSNFSNGFNDNSLNLNGEGGGAMEDGPIGNNSVICKDPPPDFGRRIWRWTEEEISIYQLFLKWFKVILIKRGRNKRLINFGWDGDSGKDLLPFCGTCRDKLLELVGIERRMEELERRILRGVEELKGKANECEESFNWDEIYEKDGRYRRVREQIVGCSGKGEGGKRRKSMRTKQCDPVNCLETLPVITEIKEEPDTYPEDDGTGTEALINKNGHRSLFQEPRIDKADGDQEEDAKFPEDTDDFHDNDPMSPPPSSPPPPPKRRGRPKRNVKIVVEDEEDINSSPPPPKISKRTRNPRKLQLEDDPIDSDLHQPPPSPPLFGKRKRKTKDPQEDDWAVTSKVDDDSLSPPSDSPSASEQEDDPQDEDYDLDLDSSSNPGKRKKNSKLIIDSIKRTITYKHLIFYQIEPFKDNKFQCSSCTQSVKNAKSGIRCHYLRKHSDLYSCKKCDFHGDSKANLRRHTSTAHEGAPPRPQRQVNCRICQKPTTSSRRKLHEWSHKNQQERKEAVASNASDVPTFEVRKHQCDQCGRQYSCAASLRNHKENKHGDDENARLKKMELCPECGGTFVSLQAHRQMIHGVNAKTYTCLEPGCGKVFKGLCFLAKHKNAVHRKIRPWKCSMCPREFSGEKSFKNHMNLHLGVRPWKCEHCPSAFTTKSNWQRHTELYHKPGGVPPKRKPFVRGPTMLGSDVKKRDLVSEGKYLPPSALATWAAGREPTSHFPVGMGGRGGEGGTNDGGGVKGEDLKLILSQEVNI